MFTDFRKKTLLANWLPWQQGNVYFRFIKLKILLIPSFEKLTKFQGASLFRFGVLSHLLGMGWKTPPPPVLIGLKNKYVEAERTFKPSFSEDIWAKDHVPSLRIICASQIRAFGDVLKLDDLPYDCQILIRYLPKIVESKDVPLDPALSVNQSKATNDGPSKDNRILPSWMLQRQLIEDDQDGLPAAEVKGVTITN